jgi:hypothetical protein
MALVSTKRDPSYQVGIDEGVVKPDWNNALFWPGVLVGH